MTLINEEIVEKQSIEWFKELGFEYKSGNEISQEGRSPERKDFKQVVLEERLRTSLISINPEIPNQEIINSVNQIINPNIPDLLFV